METVSTFIRWTVVILIVQEAHCACIPSYYQNYYQNPILHKCTDASKASIQQQPGCYSQQGYCGHNSATQKQACNPQAQTCSQKMSTTQYGSYCAHSQTYPVQQTQLRSNTPSGESVVSDNIEPHKPYSTSNCNCQRNENISNYDFQLEPSCGCQQQNTTESPSLKMHQVQRTQLRSDYPSGKNVSGVCKCSKCGSGVVSDNVESYKPYSTSDCNCRRNENIGNYYDFQVEPGCGCQQQNTTESPSLKMYHAQRTRQRSNNPPEENISGVCRCPKCGSSVISNNIESQDPYSKSDCNCQNSENITNCNNFQFEPGCGCQQQNTTESPSLKMYHAQRTRLRSNNPPEEYISGVCRCPKCGSSVILNNIESQDPYSKSDCNCQNSENTTNCNNFQFEPGCGCQQQNTTESPPLKMYHAQRTRLRSNNPPEENISGVCRCPKCGSSVISNNIESQDPYSKSDCNCQNGENITNCNNFQFEPGCGCQRQNTTASLLLKMKSLEDVTTAPTTITPKLTTTPKPPLPTTVAPPSVASRFSGPWTFPVHPKIEDIQFFRS